MRHLPQLLTYSFQAAVFRFLVAVGLVGTVLYKADSLLLRDTVTMFVLVTMLSFYIAAEFLGIWTLNRDIQFQAQNEDRLEINDDERAKKAWLASKFYVPREEVGEEPDEDQDAELRDRISQLLAAKYEEITKEEFGRRMGK